MKIENVQELIAIDRRRDPDNRLYAYIEALLKLIQQQRDRINVLEEQVNADRMH